MARVDLNYSTSDGESGAEDKPIKVEWSDEGNDGAAAYEQFKNQISKKRKRGRKSATGVGKRKKYTIGDDGRPIPGQVASRDSDEDNDILEHNLPDYLWKRKRDFEDNKAQLDHTGLRLPPSYSDVDFSDDERLGSLTEKPSFPLVKPCAPYQDIESPYSLGVIPASVAQWLKQYQVEGVSFLHELFIYQKGGILGDDMGLGKTIQVIACLTAAFGKTGDERDAKRMRKMRRAVTTRWYPRVLIVCPGTLMENWKFELEKWGWWSVDTFHGSVDAKESAIQAAKSGRLEIMITTYTTYRLNKETINMVEWDCVVADECHIIKDRKSGITQAMNEVNALCRIGLTGTAIQNKYEELWTLLNWTNPGRFGPLSNWKIAISEPLKIGQSHDATTAQLSNARRTAKKLVHNLLPQFFLRRMKTLIADQLPKKSDRVVFCPLTDLQADAYENFIAHDVVQYIRTSTEICPCGSGKKCGWCCYARLPETDAPWQTQVFPAIAALRNLSNHLGLLIPSGNEPDRMNKDLDNLKIAMPEDWKELYEKRESIVTLANRNFCGKWTVLNKLLKFWHGAGDKVLVFSHSVRLLRLLQLLFKSTAYNVSYLDGGMSYTERARTVDDFNADPAQFVFLISTRAGGVGLNITSANKVVVVDPNWNPAYDLQAQDRAYRIGQTRDVEVFRLVSAGTIEEIVYARQIYKQQQANIGYTASLERRYFKGVQENKEKKGEIFGLQNLFAYQGDSVVLRDIVNKTNIAESKAGVSVIGLDVEEINATQDTGDDDDPLKSGGTAAEDAAISHLAKQISKGDASPNVDGNQHHLQPPTKTDAIQGILAGAGVEYTHENSEVVGSSKIEARLSRRAERTGNSVNHIDELVFAPSQSQSQSQSQRPGPKEEEDDDNANDELETDVNNEHDGNDETRPNHESHQRQRKPAPKRKVAFRYRPPDDVRKRQFCSMARAFGFEDATTFALAVEGWTQAQRRACLERFYDRIRRGDVRA